MRRSLLILLAFVVLLASCSTRSVDEVDVDQEETPVPTAQPSPSPTQEPTATPEPSPTPEPTPTSTPEPEETPEATATATPEPEPEPEPESELTERSTLTGEAMSDLPPRPIAVRIDNSPNARPHSGLVDADLVYESPTEASLTRFLALFQTNAPEVVGPTRSARLMDVDVVPLHDAMLAYSGASIGVQDRLWQRGLPLLVLEGNASSASWRDNSRSAPHNLYTSIPALREVASDHGWTRGAENIPFTFGDTPESGINARGVDIPYVSGYVEFRYNEETDSYDRIVGGVEARDANSDEIVSPRNVIVMWAPFFVGDIAPNTRGEISNDTDLYGSGPAWVFRNGQQYVVEWRRAEQSQPFRYFDRETGAEIPLSEGKIWINLLPEDMNAERVE
jgi:hypothetical protein